MFLSPLHVNFGAGALTFGLIAERHDPDLVDLVIAARTSSAPLARAASKTHNARLLIDGNLKVVAFNEFLWYDTPSGEMRLQDLLLSNRPLIITTAVRMGQDDVLELLEPLLSKRCQMVDAPTVVIPCENTRSARWASLRQIDGVQVATNVLVDRICREIERDGARLIATEKYFEWKASFDD